MTNEEQLNETIAGLEEEIKEKDGRIAELEQTSISLAGDLKDIAYDLEHL